MIKNNIPEILFLSGAVVTIIATFFLNYILGVYLTGIWLIIISLILVKKGGI